MSPTRGTETPRGAPRGGADAGRNDEASRLAYLREIASSLWPEPATVVVGSGGNVEPGRVVSEFVLVPSAARPRLLVSGTARRAAAAAVRRYGEPQSRLAHARGRLLSLALATGVGPVVMRDRVRVYAAAAEGDGIETIETYLGHALGRDLTVSLHLGPARANRKPVLQLLTPGGDTVGFAKVGVNPLTRALVRAEHDSLLDLGGSSPRHTTVPGVLHHGRWNDLEILVQSPLPVWLPRAGLTDARLVASMREIAQVGGVRREPLAASPYWRSLRERMSHLEDGESASALRAAADRVADRAGETALLFGAWHGDWTPWNMASLRHTLLVWDWERFTKGVPMGFDALHHALQTAVVRQRQAPVTAAGACVETAPALLAPFDVEAGEAHLTALLYLADLTARYLSDRQAEAGAWLGAPEHWLLPVLTERTAQL